MPNRIFKFEIGIQEKQVVKLPSQARIIRCDVVEGRPYIWAICPVTEDGLAVGQKEERHLEGYKTGQMIHTNVDYLEHLGELKFVVGEELCIYLFENLAERRLVTPE